MTQVQVPGDPVPAGDNDSATDEVPDAGTEEPGPPGDAVDAPLSCWAGLRAFWLTAAALFVILFALIPALDNGNVAVPDDGVYAAQASLLANGSWSHRRPAAAIDSDGFNSAIGPDLAYKDRQIPYLKHPLFPTVLSGFYRAADFGGLIAFSTIGLWLASLAAGLLGRRLDPRYGMPALLLTGLGTPLVFDAYLVSAHAMAAALCGFTLLGVAQIVDGRRWWPMAYVLPCVALLVFLRTEGTVAMLAVAVVVGATSLHLRPFRVDRREACTAAAVAGVVVVAYLVDSRWSQWVASIGGAGGPTLIRQIPADRDPLGAAWISLIRPSGGNVGGVQPVIVFVLVALTLASVVVKVAPRRWLLPLSLIVLAAGALVYQQSVPTPLVTGLVATFPVLLAGLILLNRRDLHDHVVVRSLAVAALTAAAVTLVAYDVGGAAEWGGRFYHLLIPVLVPVVVVGLHNGFRRLPAAPARVAVAAVVVIGICLSLLALQYISKNRGVAKTTVRTATEFAVRQAALERDVHAARPLVIFGLLHGSGLSRMFWSPWQTIDPLAAREAGDVFTLITRASSAGYPRVTLVTDMPPRALGFIGAKRLAGTGWRMRQIRAIPGTWYRLVEFGPEKAPGT